MKIETVETVKKEINRELYLERLGKEQRRREVKMYQEILRK